MQIVPMVVVMGIKAGQRLLLAEQAKISRIGFNIIWVAATADVLV